MTQKPTMRERRRMTQSARRGAFKKRNIVRCAYCGKGLSRKTATGDHVQPISRGGQNKQRNIVMACSDCNQRKRSMEPGTFMRLIRADGTYMAKRKGAPGARR